MDTFVDHRYTIYCDKYCAEKLKRLLRFVLLEYKNGHGKILRIKLVSKNGAAIGIKHEENACYAMNL